MIRKAINSLVILTLVYGNLVVLSTLSGPHYERLATEPAMPVPTAVYDLFLLPHMFLQFSQYHDEPVVQGRRAGSSWEDQSGVLELRVGDFIPFSPGQQLLRLHSRKFYVLGQVERQKRAKQLMAAKILNQHNAENPDLQIDALRFGIKRRDTLGTDPQQVSFIWLNEP